MSALRPRRLLDGRPEPGARGTRRVYRRNMRPRVGFGFVRQDGEGALAPKKRVARWMTYLATRFAISREQSLRN